MPYSNPPVMLVVVITNQFGVSGMIMFAWFSFSCHCYCRFLIYVYFLCIITLAYTACTCTALK